MPNIEDLMTTHSAAEFLGIPYRTLMYYIRIGKLKPIKKGRDLLIARSAVEDLKGKTKVKKQLNDEQVQKIQERHRNGDSVELLAKDFSVGRATIYRHLKHK